MKTINPVITSKLCHFAALLYLALVALLATPSPLSAEDTALEFRTFPEGPIFAKPLNQGLHLSDIMLHNLAIINRSDTPLDVQRIVLTVTAREKTLVQRVLERDEIESSADRFSRNSRFGVFERLPQLFGHNRMFDSGEELSPTPLLESQNALIVIQTYFAYQGAADELRVNVDYLDGADEEKRETAVFAVQIETYESPNVYRLPLTGAWRVSTGPDISSHHRTWQDTEFAYDFDRTAGGGSTFANRGLAPSDYYAYGEPVFAAAEGIIIKAIDQYPEAPLREEGESLAAYQTRMSDRMNENFANDPDANYGNIVIIEHEGGEFSSYTHLKRGTLQVKTGEHVAAGGLIGKVGQSGNSLSPHLHFSVANGSGRSLPVVFANVRLIDGETISTILKTGEFIAAE